MKVKELKNVIDRLDPEADVLAAVNAIDVGHEEVQGSRLVAVYPKVGETAVSGTEVAAGPALNSKPTVAGRPTKHNQVHLKWGVMEGDIDEDLVPLILSLWQYGIRTVASCQENRPGIAWVEFLT